MTQLPTDQAGLSLVFECEATSGVQWGVQHAMLEEQLNEPYTLALKLTSDTMMAEPVQMLGQPVQLTIIRGSAVRMVTGIVTSVKEGSTNPQTIATFVVVRPALEALRHRVNTKIFQQKTVPQIIEEVLGEGLGRYGRSIDNRLSRAYRTCDYRVQYNESDFSFCERLMEEEGIVYWFECEGETETMVIADAPDKYGTIESIHSPTLEFTEYSSNVGGHEYVGEMFMTSQVLPTKMAMRHFDWNRPSFLHEGASADAPAGDTPNGAFVAPDREVYEHDTYPLTFEPGSTTYANDKDDQVSIRREAAKHDARVASGWSSVFGMRVGATFSLMGHTRAELDGEYLVTAVSHDFSGSAHYRNDFWCIPKDVVFRPRRVTPRPRIPSIQTATVVGPTGEEIHTDEHGRIKVQFHWDRLGTLDEHSSLWVRVMQPWGGTGWGFFFIPRIGMEVVVNFVDGDPDRPLVIGSVYNGENPPPLSLPDEKTKSTLKTNSSLGGGGFNELRFEDKAQNEEIYCHAQKDYNEVVENDHSTLIHHDQTNTVDNNQTEIIHVDQTMTVNRHRTKTVVGNETTTVQGNRTESVTGNETISIASNRTESVTGNETISVASNRSESVTGNETIGLGANRSVSVAASDILSIGGSRKMSVGGSVVDSITAAYQQTVLGAHNVTVGGLKAEEVGLIYKIGAGIDYTVDAGSSIKLKTGSSEIELKSDGTINIKGVKIEINGKSLIKLRYTKIEENC